MKKILSILMAIIVVMSASISNYQVIAYTDLETIEYERSRKISWCEDMGLMMGTSKKSFSPDKGLSKAMAVTVLHRFYNRLGIDNAVEKVVDSIKDVSENAYYNEAALWAVSNGIISLTSDGKLEPSEVITIKEFMEMLYNFHRNFSKTGVTDNIGDAMDWANENNLLTELEDSKAKTSVTREMAAVVFYRYDDINHPRLLDIDIDAIDKIEIWDMLKIVEVSKDIYAEILEKFNNYDYVKKELVTTDGGSGHIRFNIKKIDKNQLSIGYLEDNYIVVNSNCYIWNSDEAAIDSSWFEEIFYYKDNISPPYD